MTELNLSVSGKLDEHDVQTIRIALGNYVKVGNPSRVFQRSADPPSIIELLGEVPLWAPLAVAAAAYFSQIAKRAGDATWDSLASRFKGKEINPIIDIATTLSTVVDEINGEVKIVFGLNIPDEIFGTTISANARDPAEVARALSSFVVHADLISEFLHTEFEQGRKPIGSVIVNLQDDGRLLLKWCDQTDFQVREKYLP